MQPRYSRRITPSAGLFLIAIGAMVLLGWALEVEVLKALSRDITMKANAAFCLLACGVSLSLLGAPGPAKAAVRVVCGSLVLATAGLTLGEHLFGWDVGLDQLLFAEAPGAVATTSPGRMGPNGSLCLTLAGLALLCLERATPRTIAAAQVLGAVVAALALVPTVGYMYGATELYAVARYTGIALHTSVSLLVLGTAILAARPADGPVSAVLNDAPHGLMARRLLAVAVVVPMALGYVRLAGQARGWYDAGFGLSMFVVAMIVLLSLTIWRTAVALARTNADLVRAERDRSDLLARERAARETAEQADRAKDEFIAALSHELRTPLNAILGWMYMLRTDTVPESARGKAAEAVVRNAGLLARLIEDLLDTSRITTGHLTLTRSAVDLAAVVRAAAESVLPASVSQGVRVILDAPPALPMVNGDAQRLQQVMWNLLSNAIKFSRAGDEVRIGLKGYADYVVVSVADQGEGIDPAFLPFVFERFQQADPTTVRAQAGLGLGLYIARHLTELHGGTLHAHSQGVGKGTVLTMRIPVS